MYYYLHVQYIKMVFRSFVWSIVLLKLSIQSLINIYSFVKLKQDNIDFSMTLK